MNRRSFVKQSFLVGSAACIGRLGLAQSVPSTPARARFCWMKAYSGLDTHKLLSDRRMHTIARRLYSSAKMPFWTSPTSGVLGAYTTMLDFIGGPTDPIRVDHSRFILASGHMGHFALNSALLWIDTHYDGAYQECRSVFSVLDVTSPTLTLYVVPNNSSDYQSLNQLPHNYKLNLRRWLHANRSKFTGKINQMLALNIATGATRKAAPEELNLAQVRFTASAWA